MAVALCHVGHEEVGQPGGCMRTLGREPGIRLGDRARAVGATG
jgi:hypothetical protein